MQPYFFHVEHGELHRDLVGTMFPTSQSAKAAAVQLLAELLREESDKFWAIPDMTVIVTDATNLTLWTVSAVGIEAASAMSYLPRPR